MMGAPLCLRYRGMDATLRLVIGIGGAGQCVVGRARLMPGEALFDNVWTSLCVLSERGPGLGDEVNPSR